MKSVLAFVVVVGFLVSILCVFGGSYFALLWCAQPVRELPFVTLALGIAALVCALMYARFGVMFMGVALRRLQD